MTLMGAEDTSGVADTTGDAGWVPVTVTAVLAEPVVTQGRPVHLDGPLAWAAFLEWTDGAGHCALPPASRSSPPADFMLPLATWTAPALAGADPAALNGEGLAWGWACSRARYGTVAHGTLNVRRRPAADVAARYGRDRKWDSAAGPLKARDVPYGTLLAREVTWHALGDPAGVSRLLARVHHLGGLRGHGNGRVLSWRAEPGGDRDAWRDRVLPLPGGAPGRIRVPYWHPSREMPCTP